MNYIAKLYQRWNDFLHNEELKEKINIIVERKDATYKLDVNSLTLI